MGKNKKISTINGKNGLNFYKPATPSPIIDLKVQKEIDLLKEGFELLKQVHQLPMHKFCLYFRLESGVLLQNVSAENLNTLIDLVQQYGKKYGVLLEKGESADGWYVNTEKSPITTLTTEVQSIATIGATTDQAVLAALKSIFQNMEIEIAYKELKDKRPAAVEIFERFQTENFPGIFTALRWNLKNEKVKIFSEIFGISYKPDVSEGHYLYSVKKLEGVLRLLNRDMIND